MHTVDAAQNGLLFGQIKQPVNVFVIHTGHRKHRTGCGVEYKTIIVVRSDIATVVVQTRIVVDEPLLIQRHHIINHTDAEGFIKSTAGEPACGRVFLVGTDRHPAAVDIGRNHGLGITPEALVELIGNGHFLHRLAGGEQHIRSIMVGCTDAVIALQEALMGYKTGVTGIEIVPCHVNMVPASADQQEIPCMVQLKARYHHGFHADPTQQQAVEPCIALTYSLITEQHAVCGMAEILLFLGTIDHVVVIVVHSHPLMQVKCLFGGRPGSVNTGHNLVHHARHTVVLFLIYIILDHVGRHDSLDAVLVDGVGHGILDGEHTDIIIGNHGTVQAAKCLNICTLIGKCRQIVLLKHDVFVMILESAVDHLSHGLCLCRCQIAHCADH